MAYLEYALQQASMPSGDELVKFASQVEGTELNTTLPEDTSTSLQALMKTASANEAEHDDMFTLGRCCALSKYAGAWDSIKGVAGDIYHGAGTAVKGIGNNMIVAPAKKIRNAWWSMRHGGLARTDENVKHVMQTEKEQKQVEHGQRIAEGQLANQAQEARLNGIAKIVGAGSIGAVGLGGIALARSGGQPQPVMYMPPQPAPMPPQPAPMPPQQPQATY